MRTPTSLRVIILFSFIYNIATAQHHIIEVPLETQISNSSLIVEGKVVTQYSTWDDKKRLIYTINTVEIFKVFKGKPTQTIDIVTVGGTVGMTALIANPSLILDKGDTGIFMLSSSKTALSNKGDSNIQKYKPQYLNQSFYKYNLKEDIAANATTEINSITNGLLDQIEYYTKQQYKEVKSFDIDVQVAKSTNSKGVLAPGIITFDKSVVSGGTKDRLTITGSDFGANQGKVWFRDSNNGGSGFISALDTQVLSWSNTEIVVEVPSRAGTGTIFVEDSSGDDSPLSSDVLVVAYAESNVNSNFNGTIPETAFQVQHVSRNVNGGMTWQMQTDFFNDTEVPGAREAFTRAMNTWICETGINFEIATSPTTADPSGSSRDGINIVRFDNGSELNSNTLGINYSFYSGCSDGLGSIEWYVDELDMVFNDNVNWFTGTGVPANNQFDLESVALHELGHSHQLGHIIELNNNMIGNNAEDVMHFTFTNGEFQRFLSQNNSTGANAIQTRSEASAVCGESVMTGISCSTLNTTNIGFAKEIKIYPNPTNGMLFIETQSNIGLKHITLHELSGRKVAEFLPVSIGQKNYSLNLEAYASGVYLLTIKAKNQSFTSKIVLE